MDVMLIADESQPTLYRDLGPRKWFVFADCLDVFCVRLPGGGYQTWLTGNCTVLEDIDSATRPVIRLELAGTDGQTLLLRRAE